jgi:hypothetical protein
MIKNGLLISIFIATMWSCHTPNDETEILFYSLEMDQSEVEVRVSGTHIYIEFPDNITSASSLVAEFELSEGAIALVKDIIQVSGQSLNNYEKPISYEIQAEDEITKRMWNVTSSNNPYTSNWGMGGFQKVVVSNDREYEWYMDQRNTGTYSNNNCGPTTTVMASLWSDPEYTNTPSDARSIYRPEGGWWYTSDIKNYLDDYGIPNYTIQLGSTSSSTVALLKRELDQGSIAILCLDMYFVDYQAVHEFRTNKFYTTTNEEWGHFMLIKGYREVDGELYWEAYDSNSWGTTYSDGTLKGKNRYYHSKEIHEATSVWWNYAIIVSEIGKKGLSAKAVEFSEIPVAYGR